MIAEELINHMIPPLKQKDDAHKALVWMEELRCNELPVVRDGHFLGFITEDMIMEANDAEKLIETFDKIGKQCVLGSGSHMYDVIKMAAENEMKMVSVQDHANTYMGVITVQDTINSMAQSIAIQMPGSILVLSIPHIDYSLSQISRLVEENNAKILSSSVKEDDVDSGQLRVTLKINKPDLAQIVATYERFGYKVIGRFQESQIVEKDKEKLDMLFRFLDI
ncbi:MAG: CBS domain-containing protein [Bacteroidota bacterium]